MLNHPEPALPAAEHPLRLGFIGAGRLGTALAWSLHAHGHPTTAVASRSAAAADELAAGLPGCLVATPQQVVDSCELVFITTPDAVIQPLVDSLRWRPGVAVVHCSGATELEALASAVAQGAEAGGFHPLQSVADPALGARTLPGCTVTIEAQGTLLRHLTDLARRLGCPVNTLPPGQRAAYHAAAGYASQFVHVLMAEATSLWRQWGATEEQALQALLPLLRGTVASLQAKGVAGGMPGPVSRGDLSSVARHLGALDAIDLEAHSAHSLGALYRSLCLRSVPLAEQRGCIDATQAAAFRALLQPLPATSDAYPVKAPPPVQG